MMKLLAVCVLLPAVFCAVAEERQGLAATGAGAVNYGQTTASNENHDKKNFGLNFSSDKGSSNQYSQTGLQTGLSGGVGQVHQQPIVQPAPIAPYPYHYNPYPYYQYPYYYQPQYQPTVVGGGYPLGGQQVGVAGSSSQVNVPGVSAGSGAVGVGTTRY